MPERKHFEIRFPIVESFVVDLKRNLIRCDVANVAFVRPQVGYQIGHASAHGGFGFEMMDRQQYYNLVHPQTITFEIAKEIVRVLTEAANPGKERLKRQGRSVLFPSTSKP